MKVAKFLAFAAVAVAAVPASVSAEKKRGSKRSASSASSGASASTPTKSSDDGALLTIPGSFSFAKNSLVCGADLATFMGQNAYRNLVLYLPPDLRFQLENGIEDALAQVDGLRLQNGLPTFTEVKNQATLQWERHAAPVVDKVISNLRKPLHAPHMIMLRFIRNFEDQYPAHKGLLGGAQGGSDSDVFDVAFVLWFVLYVCFYKVLWSWLLCQVVLCGCCCGARRNPAAASARPVHTPSVVKPSHVTRGKKRN